MEIKNHQRDPMRDQIYLAALLHDIGKFYQRADSGAVNSSKYLKEETKNLEKIICPQFKGYSSHKHVLWTAQFILDFEKVFNNLVKKSSLTDLKVNQSLLHLAADHHLSANQISLEGRIIREADHLSSGMDRSTDDAFKDDQDEKSWDSFKTKRMVSIFEGILKDSHSHAFHLPVEAMKLANSLMPSKQFAKNPDYETVWLNFINEFKFLQQENYRDFSETLLYLLYKYTCTIPSSTINFPDVSLFDHLKTTAAMAVCLYDWEMENEHKPEDPFLLIGADFSGIQNYIYNILSKSAAKNLKGRSFYIKLLSDSIVTLMLQELNLFEANVIYNAGGGFFILAPNTKHVVQKLSELNHTIEEKIFEAHGTSLYVAIDSLTLSKATLLGQEGAPSIGDCWTMLFDKRDNKKSRRYSDKIIQNYGLFFEPGELGGITQRDAITGEEISETERNVYSLEGKTVSPSDKKTEVIREITYKQISLGRKLKEASIWVISRHPISYWNDKDSINPGNLGIYYYFLSENDLKSKTEQLKSSADSVKIISINGNHNGLCDFLDPALQGSNNVYGFEFLGGNDFPSDKNGDPKLFDELAGDEGFRRLGILRMDVDNLGNIFKNGLKSSQSTFSRFAALSRNLDWFFKGYLNTIWEKEFKQSTYIVYSGGDDLFIVGQWNACIAFAERIKEEFKLFTCQNDYLSISGGVAIVSPKFPIKKGADESAEAEKAAKNYNVDEKNAISFLGYALGWQKEYSVVKQVKDEILALLKSDKLPKSFISKLNSHYSLTLAESQDKGKFTIPPRLFWLMAYDYSRMINRSTDPIAAKLIDQCKKDVVIDKWKNFETYHAIQLWHLAARWAELEFRTNNLK